MAVIEEKPHASQHEEPRSDEDRESDTFTPKEQAKIRHRIDRRLIPALGLMYGISLMDRKNVSNAAIAGMRTDLDLLIGYRYSLITLSFFITYVTFQPPATVACRKIGPRPLPTRNLPAMGRTHHRLWLRTKLADTCWAEIPAWNPGSRLLSRLRVPTFDVVYTL